MPEDADLRPDFSRAIPGVDYSGDWESSVHFPVSQSQFSGLVGKVMQHIEAMNLPPRAEAAAKSLTKSSMWAWWADAQHNSVSSHNGIIGPIDARVARSFGPTIGTNPTSEDGEMLG